MTRELVREPITQSTLAPLAERYGHGWKIWPSAQGEYACATLRRGVSWVCATGRLPVGRDGAYVMTLVTDSPRELHEAIEAENENIARLIADGTLRRLGGDSAEHRPER